MFYRALIAVLILLSPVVAFAQPDSSFLNLKNKELRLPEKTVQTLPSATSNAGKVFIVTDGDTNSDCSSGGGSSISMCRSNGTSWEYVGDTLGWELSGFNTSTNNSVGIGTSTTDATLTVEGTASLLGTHGEICGPNSGTTSCDSFFDFNDGPNGSIRIGGKNNTNNVQVDLDFETNAHKLTLSPVYGTNLKPNASTMGSLYVEDGAVEATMVVAGGAERGKQGQLSTNLVSYWRLEENAANTTISDTMGTNNCTFDVNTSTRSTTGLLGNAIDFVASDTNRADCGSGASLKITGAQTYFARIKATSTATGVIMGNRSNSGSNIGNRFQISATGKLWLSVDTGTEYNQRGTRNVRDGKWHDVAAVLNGTDTACVYVDSVQDFCFAYSGDPGTGAGNFFLGNVPNTSTYANFIMDDVRVYNAALTTDDLKYLYNGGLGIDPSVSGASTAYVNIMSTSAATTSHSLNDGNDLLVNDDLEVNDDLFVDGDGSFTGPVGIGTTTPATGVKAVDYFSGDGTQGITQTCGGVSITGFTVKDGLITSCTGT